MAKQNTTKAPCRNCGVWTSHVVLKSKTYKTYDDEDDEEIGMLDGEPGLLSETTYEMIECSGCECVTLRETERSCESDEPEVRYFPPPGSRRQPTWGGILFPDLRMHWLLDEVYTALNAHCHWLATMGCRALIDMVMTDLVGDIGGFERKLGALEDKGFIAKHHRDLLTAALETGHAASHRGHRPTTHDLNSVLDIVEMLLHQIYVLPEVAAELKKSTPPRVRGNVPGGNT